MATQGQTIIGRRGKPLEEVRRERQKNRRSQSYQAFLKALCAKTGWDAEFAERAAVCVLGLLEYRISGDEARDLEAQLPDKLVELLHTGEPVTDVPFRKLNLDRFIRLVEDELNREGAGDAEAVIRQVFDVVRERVSEGEVDQVVHQLPKDLQALWRPVS